MKIKHGIIIGLAAALAGTILHGTGYLNRLENITWDWRVKALAQPCIATDRICLILVDQTSLDWAEETLRVPAPWPWPRQFYSPILAACRHGSAKAVALDILFTEESMLGVDDDLVFGQAIAETPGFVPVMVLGQDQGTQTSWPANVNLNQFEISGLSNFLKTPVGVSLQVPCASFPVDPIVQNTRILAGALAVQDEDAIIRRAMPFNVFDGRIVPSLGLAAFLAEESGTQLSFKGNALHTGFHRIPFDKNGRVILRYRGKSQTHKAVSAASVLQAGIQVLEGQKPQMDLSIFKNAYVFMGVVAPGFKDLRPTPLAKDYPGVELHATLLDNLLSHDFLVDPPIWVTLSLTVFLAVAAGICIRLATKASHVTIVTILFLPVPLLAGFACYKAGHWLPVALPWTSTFFALASGIVMNYSLEGRQKRFIKNAFRQYLSPTVIDRLVENPEKLSLGGESRELTIFFSDVQGFTGISESLSPEMLTAVLNEYLTAMTDIILDQGGTIDKYEGDAIIAFWNAPLDIADHAVRGVQAALLCQSKLAEMGPHFQTKISRDLVARIGMNTGRVVVGNMGSSQRFDYTFLGDAGNLASRLEGINKQFGTRLMISEFTRNQLGEAFPTREISRVQVVGRAEPVRVYEPMLADEYNRREQTLQTFAHGLARYYDGDFQEALNLFGEIQDQDPPAKAYYEKCRNLLKTPPEKWDGIWTMTEK